jgi:hypothetical protein
VETLNEVTEREVRAMLVQLPEYCACLEARRALGVRLHELRVDHRGVWGDGTVW